MADTTGTTTTTLTEHLASFGATIRFEDMPDKDVAAIKRLVLDTLGCALGAVGCEPVRMLAPLLRAPSDKDDAATLIGSGQRVTLADAILHNGALVRYLDYMDVYWARDICHPSENIPAALSAAEASHRSGKVLIEAIALGYEAEVRLADAFSLDGIGLHHVSAAGFVVPLMLGKLWGMGETETAHAIALGGYRHLTSAALVRGRLSMAKALGYAWPSSECVASTKLAAAGFTGPLRVLEEMGVTGFDLWPGTSSARRVSMKHFPIQFSLQSPVEAALDLREKIGGDVGGIAAINVEMHASALKRIADPAKFAPANRETADHSLPCCVAMALADGELTPAQFKKDRWKAEDVKALMAKLTAKPSAELEQKYPNGRPARLTVTLNNGTSHTVLIEAPLGDSSRPMDDQELRKKFMAQAVPVLGSAQAARAADAVMGLEKIEDVSEVCRLMAAQR